MCNMSYKTPLLGNLATMSGSSNPLHYSGDFASLLHLKKLHRFKAYILKHTNIRKKEMGKNIGKN
jgi:hypothetical protein